MTTEQPSQEQVVKQLCWHERCKGKGSYALRASCMNCGWSGTLELTRGHEFSRYAQSCPKCDCSGLTRTVP